ncbi:MAG TPA: Dyp-type peroxidase [Acidimicrobiales bacterium]|jgi:putative iron-dependent peroxidase
MQPPADNTAPEAQKVLAPLSTAAIFLVVTMQPGDEGDAAMRAMGEDIGALVRSIGFRDLEGALSCVVGIGSDAWDRIVAPAPPETRPRHLHRFQGLEAGGRSAPSTPGDLLFHIRATRFDLCFELAATILRRLGPQVASADEVHGFRYFEARDLLGFVDGTENPVGDAMADAAIIGDEEPDYAGGSYVIVQKYLHDLDAWNALSVEEQELAIGRTKLEDIELDDAVKPPNAHNALNVIEVDGEQVDILRDNMPFGSAAGGEFGTYFIGYARDPGTTEQMLQNMFVGLPEGTYDRILDFSTAITGSLYFVPSLPLLESLSAIETVAAEPAGATPERSDGSLGIGTLR